MSEKNEVRKWPEVLICQGIDKNGARESGDSDAYLHAGSTLNCGVFWMLPNGTNESGGSSPAGILPPDEIVFGRSAVMQSIRQTLNKVIGVDVPVLLDSAAGTGKEVLARWIHSRSPWKAGPFVKVNCAAIPGTLLESELFGFEKGAFTGAIHRKPGRVELAQGGTLYLDHIGEIDNGLQAKLLQVLQDGRYSKIGGQEEEIARARVICATNKNLEMEIDAGRFRSDLFYRINVVRIQLPKLRERREDIASLAEYLRNFYTKQFGLEREPLSGALISVLAGCSWPGNIRELSNCIARYVLLGAEGTMVAEIPNELARTAKIAVADGPVSLKRIAKNAAIDMERSLIMEALRANNWNRRRAAQDLKISYRTLIYKIRESGIGARKAERPLQKPGTRSFATD
jgi:two-component system response regulator AtoC